MEGSPKQNGKHYSNGSVVHNKDHRKNHPEREAHHRNQTQSRVGYPQESDRRKLSQLFDSLKKPEKVMTIQRASSRQYSDSDSSSSDDDLPASSVPPSVMSSSLRSSPVNSLDRSMHSEKGNNSEFDVVSFSELNSKKPNNGNNSRKTMHRMQSYDSDQTIHSDDAPFSKSSTETQILVDVHSDSSSSLDVRPKTKSSPTKSKSSKPKETVSVMRADSSSSHQSELSDQGVRNRPIVRQPVFPPGRSPSPYSFDSIPSSHANSPLMKRKNSEVPYDGSSRYSSDTDTHISTNTDFSGTESQARGEGVTSEADDVTTEESTHVKFARVSINSKRSSTKSSVLDTNSKYIRY